MILEYKLTKYPQGMMTPSWVEDGGYWYDKSNKTFIGWSPDEANRDYYIPDTVTELTRDELVSRVVGLSPTKIDPAQPGKTIAMTQTEIEESVDSWINAKG